MVNLEFLSLSHNSKSLSLVGEGWGGYIYIYICAIFYLAISGIEKKSFLLTCKQFEICSLDHAVAHPPSETDPSVFRWACGLSRRTPLAPSTDRVPPARTGPAAHKTTNPTTTALPTICSDSPATTWKTPTSHAELSQSRLSHSSSQAQPSCSLLLQRGIVQEAHARQSHHNARHRLVSYSNKQPGQGSTPCWGTSKLWTCTTTCACQQHRAGETWHRGNMASRTSMRLVGTCKACLCSSPQPYTLLSPQRSPAKERLLVVNFLPVFILAGTGICSQTVSSALCSGTCKIMSQLQDLLARVCA